MHEPIELISIDAYGTIFDMGAIYHTATRAVLDRLAPHLPEVDFSSAWSRRFNDHYHATTDCEPPTAAFPTISALTAYALDETLREFAVSSPNGSAVGTAIWMDHLSRVPLYPDVHAALVALSGRFRLILTSDSDEAIIGPALARHQLPFERIFVSETCRSYKMARRDGLLELAIRRAEVPPARVIHVGDSAADLIAAQRAGCRGVWIRRPGHPDPGHPPWRTIASLHDLAAL
ncbi:MAG: HAD family hydrolase [Planctomycetota bacterium]